MPKFAYELRKEDGNIVKGTVEASSLMEASERLQRMDGYLVNVEPEASENVISKLQNIRLESGPGLKDVMYFTKQIAVMVRAGISIREAVEIISDQMTNIKFKNMLVSIRRDVESGLQFSDALAKYPKTFSGLYVNMVRASEMSGTFSHMLERIALYLEQQQETRSMVRGAMTYPAVLGVMSVGAVIFMLTWVLPRFMKIFKGKEHLLPKPTQMMIAVSNFLQYQWGYLLVGIAAFVTGIILLKRTEQGQWFFARMQFKIPLMGRMFRSLYIARSLQTMGELTNAGVPVLDTLNITANIAGNKVYEEMWSRVRDSVQQGNKIVSVLQRTPLLPRSVVMMIAAGEDSGRLGDVLTDISEFFQKELRDTIKAVTSMLEPLMIVIMGFVIGFIAMSIILPIFQMSKIVTDK